MENNIWEIVINYIAPAILAIFGWAGVQLVRFINAKTSREYIKAVTARLNDAVQLVVRDLSQTVVEGLKEAAADGKITEEERADLRRIALNNLKSYLGVKGLKLLIKVLGVGDLDKFLVSKIEAQIYRDKVEG